MQELFTGLVVTEESIAVHTVTGESSGGFEMWQCGSVCSSITTVQWYAGQ